MSAKNNNQIKVAYIHGRPCSHPMQQKMANSINADFFPVDFKLRWHDKPNAPKIRRYISWIICSLFFPNAKKYDVFIAAGAHVTLPLMRLFGKISSKQKIIVHLGDELLYSIYSGRFSKNKISFLKKIISKYDAIICEGEMGTEIIKKIWAENTPKTYTIVNGIENRHLFQVQNLRPNLETKNILYIAQGPGKMRLWYKGLDLLLKSYEKAFNEEKKLTLTIIGEWDDNLIYEITKNFSEDVKKSIKMVGYVSDLSTYFENSSLYLHPARGEAYGIVVLMSLASGLPTIVSEWTGAKEVVLKVSKELIVPLNVNDISKKILWYFSLTKSEKQILSINSKKLGLAYTEERAVSEFYNTFQMIIKDLND